MPKSSGNTIWLYVNIGLCCTAGMLFNILAVVHGGSAAPLLAGCACWLAGILGMSVAGALREHSTEIHTLKEELARYASSELGKSSGDATS